MAPLSDPDCTFCAIASGAPAFEVARTPRTVAFLDRTPLFPGHVLVVPTDHHITLMDLPESDVAPLFAEVRRISTAVQRATQSDGIFVAANNIVSQSVPHLHIHVVPRRRKDGLRGFFWPRQRYDSDDHAASVAAAITAALR